MSYTPQTHIRIHQGRWQFNRNFTNPGAAAEGLLLNVRMVHATFEDRNRPEFDPAEITARFLQALPASMPFRSTYKAAIRIIWMHSTPLTRPTAHCARSRWRASVR
jgi:hypothetical protein